MSLHTIRKCDECEAPRGETNHWWAVVLDPTSPRLMTSRAADKEYRHNPDVFRLDACSHKCVTTIFNRWLDTGTVIKKKFKHLKPSAKTIDATLEHLEEGARLLPEKGTADVALVSR